MIKEYKVTVLRFAFSVLLVAFSSAVLALPPTPMPKPTGELSIGMAYLGNQTLEPSLGPQSGKHYLELIYDRLVGQTDEGEIETKTGLAKSWKVSPDGMTWTFHLKEGIKFHNGDEVTAEDVKFSLERIVGPKSVSTFVGTFKANIKEVKVPDRYTVVIYSKNPWLSLAMDVSGLIGNEGMVIPKKYFQRVGEDYFGNHPIGTGPYKLKEQVLGSHITFEALDSHWRVGVPKYKTIKIFYVPEESTRIAMLKTGKASFIDVSRERIFELKPAGFKIHTVESATSVGVVLWQMSEQRVPTSDKKVRMALNLAINKKEILKAIFMDQGRETGIWPGQSWNLGFIKVEPYPYDPEKAKKLLIEAGYPKGFDMDLYLYSFAGLSEMKLLIESIAGYWSEIGVRANIIPIDYAAFRPKMLARQMPGAASAMAWPNRYLLLGTIRLCFHSRGSFGMYKGPDMDKLIEKAEASIKLEEMGKAIQDCYRFIYNNYLTVPIAEVDAPIAVNPKTIADWRQNRNAYSLNFEYLFTRR